MTRGTLEWARYYRDAGLSVIPIRPRDKRPLIAWAEYQRRLAMDDELRQWFTDDTANIGVVCGRVSGGLVVADFDNALNLRSFLDLMPDLDDGTVRVTTARGGHLWLHVAESVRPFQVESLGLDIKGEGTYVLVPPSMHPSGRPYEFANECADIVGVADFAVWLEDALAMLEVEWHPPGRSASGFRPSMDIAAALAALTVGNRNDTFCRVAGRLHRQGVSPEDIVALLEPHASRADFP